MNNKQKHIEEQEKKENIKYELKKKKYTELCLPGTLLLYVCCIIGKPKGGYPSVFEMFMDSPIKALPDLLIVTVMCIIAYIVLRLTGPKRKK